MIADSLKNLCLAEWSEGDDRPCVLERWHDADFHRDSEGYEWRVPVRTTNLPEPEAPPTRHVGGGYVLGPSYPTDGEPDWKAEAAAILEIAKSVDADLDRQLEVTASWQREALKAQGERDAALQKIVSTNEAVSNTRLQTTHEAIDIVRKVRDEWSEDGEPTAGLSAALARLTLALTKV